VEDLSPSKGKELFDQIQKLEKIKKSLTLEAKRLREQRQLLQSYADNIFQHNNGGRVVFHPNSSTSAFPATPSLLSLQEAQVALSYYTDQLIQLDDEDLKNEEKMTVNEESLFILKNELQTIKQSSLPSSTSPGLLQQTRCVMVLIHLPEGAGGGGQEEGKGQQLEQGKEMTLTLTYVVSKATWTPSYDLRLNTQQNVMDLSYYAEVTQSCGEDWKDCQVCLSTSNPAIGSSPPPVPTRTVDWDYNCERGGGVWRGGKSGGLKNKKNSGVVELRKKSTKSRLRSSGDESDEEDNYEARRGSFALMEGDTLGGEHGGGEGGGGGYGGPPGGVSSTDLTVTGHDSGSTTFIIPRKVTIESDNKPHKLTVTTASFTPQMVHYVAPSLSAFVYLQSKTLNSSPYPLLSSDKVLVFMDGNFVSITALRQQTSPGEYFTVFLGVDPSVKVQYMPCKSIQYLKGWLSGVEVKKYFYSTVVQNTKQRPIRVIVAEVLPRAADEKITVELLEPPPGNLVKPSQDRGGGGGGPILNEQDVIAGLDNFDGDPLTTAAAMAGKLPGPGGGSWPRDFVTQNKFTNNLVWLKTLQAGEKAEIKFAYRVSWPQGQSVGIR
jgi:hypothetical protein